MNAKQWPDQIERIFEVPFPHPSLNLKVQAILGVADNKLYVADTERGGVTVFVARLHQDGSLDESFASVGWVAEIIEMPNGHCCGLLPRGDGGVLVAVLEYNKLGLLCFRVDGQLDENFGNNGKIFHSVPMDDEAQARDLAVTADDRQKALGIAGLGRVALTEDGMIVGVLGARFQGPASVLLRCMANGQLDHGFGNDGIVVMRHPVLPNEVQGLGIISMSGGKVLVCGSMNGPTVICCQYNHDGTLDPQYGDDGFANIDHEILGIPQDRMHQMELTSVARLAGGGVVAVGGLTLKDPWDFFGLVVVLDSQGRPLSEFNNGKPVLFALPTGVETDFSFGGVVEQVDGKIVVAGSVTDRSAGYKRATLVVRFLPNGIPDVDFSETGYLRFNPLGLNVSYVTGVILDQGKRVLLACADGVNDSVARQIGAVVQFR